MGLEMCAVLTVISLASHGDGGMAPMTGVLEWKYTVF